MDNLHKEILVALAIAIPVLTICICAISDAIFKVWVGA